MERGTLERSPYWPDPPLPESVRVNTRLPHSPSSTPESEGAHDRSASRKVLRYQPPPQLDGPCGRAQGSIPLAMAPRATSRRRWIETRGPQPRVAASKVRAQPQQLGEFQVNDVAGSTYSIERILDTHPGIRPRRPLTALRRNFAW